MSVMDLTGKRMTIGIKYYYRLICHKDSEKHVKLIFVQGYI
jgi:hypothetical protein